MSISWVQRDDVGFLCIARGSLRGGVLSDGAGSSRLLRGKNSRGRLALDRAARSTPKEVLLEEDHEQDDRSSFERRAR